jgi:hypothetical protein
MSNHTEACRILSILCESLYKSLATRIPKLQRVETKSWCSLFSEGKKRFAYINHRKNMERIEIWCLGDPAELQKNSQFNIEIRQPTTGGFGASFKSRFFLDNISQINNACEILSTISYNLT